MDRETRRRMIEGEYRDYLKICSEKGTALWAPQTDEEIQGTSDADLIVMTKHLKDAARTPTT